jgi:cob(I)alamin adenosyltransferase
MKIYTKKGDAGEASLLGGKRVPKSDIRLMAYGTVDELNSHLGMVRSQKINVYYQDVLLEIQKKLFIIGSNLAKFAESKIELAQISESDIAKLEQEIDKMESSLPPINFFVIPGGNQAVATCHIARSIARRAERMTVALHQVAPVDELILKYLNRLSDYLFVLARSIGYDDGVEEVKWK